MFDQAPYACRLEWGPRGARDAAARGDVVIVVDVLRFSSATVTAVHHGAWIYPLSWDGDAEAFARQVGAEVAAEPAVAAPWGGHSLSPLSFGPADAGRRIVLRSPNGAAAASAAAARGARLLVGCLLNATAVAAEADRLRRSTGGCVTVVPCGEQWADATPGDQRLRPCVEDHLGAGAILARLKGSQSPEAEVCAGAFLHARPRLAELIWECGSGRELRERGLAEDVRHSLQLDRYAAVPTLVGDHFENNPG
jgi:2-phosphosulfolactate phosphatase